MYVYVCISGSKTDNRVTEYVGRELIKMFIIFKLYGVVNNGLSHVNFYGLVALNYLSFRN